MRKKILPFLFVLAFSSVLSAQVTFTDVAPSLGVNNNGAAQGCIFIDVNNDGFLDIYVLNNNTTNKLYINNGGAAFTESASTWGLASSFPGRGTSFADYNNDGYPDIVVGNWQTAIVLYKNLGTSFIDDAAASGVALMSWGGSTSWLDFNKDGKIDFAFGNDGVPYHYNYFFKNLDLTHFTNVAYPIGLTDSLSTLTISSADYDNDGDLDIFFGSQTTMPAVGTGVLYRNNGDGTFTDVSVASGLITFSYSWGAAWGDYNNDGYMDLALANTNFNSQLFRNNGNGTFTEVTDSLGISDCASSYSCGWADVDNDGDLDLYFARGLNTPDKLFRNDGTIFSNIATTAGTADTRHSSCITWGDYNNDGFLDLYLNNNGYENRLYKNNHETNYKWFILKLQGTTTNRSAIGSRVIVKTGNVTQIREVEGGSGGKGMNSLPVEFGLKQAAIIDSVIVKWQSGLVQTFVNIPVNQNLTLIEGGTIGVSGIGEILPGNFSLSQNYPNPFNPSTTIKFEVPKSAFVSIIVYDLLGREVKRLVNENRNAGTYEVNFDGSNLTSGIYFYKMTAGDFSETKKLMLVK